MDSFAHYTILDKLGEGGMGEVFRARDDRLKREVAIKVLPEAFTRDPERLARFEREAQVLARLHHPNIASIFGLEADGERRVLVLELVPGRDLAQTMAEKPGPLAVGDAVEIARQICAAVEAAHEMGIVHRDLKPANVMFTPDGTAKVLDFGLAKAGELEASDSSLNLSNSPTLTGPMTEANVILGTAAYMSPEQARGKKVDKRADIWSFGVILFEMLTGKQLFEGETVSDTLAGVLKTDIDFDALPASTPRHIRMLLERCLTRDPKTRLRDIGEARIVLEAGEDVGLPESAGDRPRSGVPNLWVGLIGLLALVGGAVAGAVLLGGGEAPPEAQAQRLLSVDPGPGPALPGQPKLSPDGTRLAYVRDGSIWVRDLDTLEPRHLERTSQVLEAFWSPDGERLAYLAGNQILTVDVDTGVTAVVTNLPSSVSPGIGAGGVWTPDRGILFTRGVDHVYRVSDRGGDPSIHVAVADSTRGDYHEPALLPDGTLVVVTHFADGGFGLTHLAGDEHHELLPHGEERYRHPEWSPTGHVLYERRGDFAGVWALPYDYRNRRILGEPFLLQSGGRAPSADLRGTLTMTVGASENDVILVEADSGGTVLRRIGEPGRYRFRMGLSPDGGRLAQIHMEEGTQDIWVHDLRRGTVSRATFDGATKHSPVWSLDGTRLYYYAGTSSSNLHTVILRVDASAPPESLEVGTAAAFPVPGSDDVLLSKYNGRTSWDLVVGAPRAGAERRDVVAEESWQFTGRVSPDGRYLAYTSRESGVDQVYLKRFPSGTGKWQVSVARGQWPQWSDDGTRLWFTSENVVMEVDVELNDPPVLGVPRERFTRSELGFDIRFDWDPNFAVNGDGTRFYFLESASETSAPVRLILLENWADEDAR